MKKNHCLIILLAIIFIIIAKSSYAQEMDALEQAYKEQYDTYTSEMKELQTGIDRERVLWDKENAILERLNQLDLQDGTYRRRPRNYGSTGVSPLTVSLQKKIDRTKELTEKKRELKIKVLEKKGNFPTWWID